MMLKVVAVVCLCVVVGAERDGAPNAACTSMTPRHDDDQAQSGDSGIAITVSATTFDCNSTLTVTLSRTTAFKGFLCQTRTNVEAFTPTGMIDVMEYHNNCEAGSSITHTNNSEKTNVSFTWKPTGIPKNFTFVCTFVETKATFWVKETSPNMILYSGSDETCDMNNNEENNGDNGNSGSYVTQSAILVSICLAIAKMSM